MEETRKRISRAEEIAAGAGEILSSYFGRLEAYQVSYKGRRNLCTAADRESERFIVEELKKDFPEDSFLAEEGVLSPAGKVQGEGPWLWIVDPLDATTNFVHGFPHFAVSIGLFHNMEPAGGVVFDPLKREMFKGIVGEGAWLNGKRIRVSEESAIERSLLCTGFSYERNDPGAETNVERLKRALMKCRGMRRTGCASLDFAYVAAGRMDGYWEIGLGPYDIGAGAALVFSAGGKVTDLSGGKDYLFSGKVIATNGVIHGELLSLVGDGPFPGGG